MTTLLSDGLILPVLILAVMGVVVPRMLAKLLPEGVRPLLLNAFLSTFLLFVLASLLFVCLYLLQGLSLSQLAQAGLRANVQQFGGLGLASGLIWVPILILTIAALPRTWVNETW